MMKSKINMEQYKDFKSTKRVAKNTLYLYFRTLFVMGVSIYTSRIILDTLGIENYGIYNVVGAFVSMFSVLSGSLTAASQRFIAFELGKGISNVKKVFSTTLSIHFLLAVITFILLEIIGLWFLNNKMNIPPNRMIAANWVFQCSVITFCINLISIPYNAAIIAYEKMSAFAYISIFEVLAKLIAVYALYMIAFDPLIVYSIFMLFVAVILRFTYGIYCSKRIPDCKYSTCFDKSIFKEISRFSGWNFIGSSSVILNGQGINMLMNNFFGVTLNAARGLSSQIDGAINTFVNNFLMALNPQITKSFAAGDFVYVNKMIIWGTKFSFFLFWVLCLPIFINTDFILNIWLKQVPDYASLFIKLGIIYGLCQTLSQCLYTTMLATGNIKKYQIVVGGLSLLAFPTAWIFFELGLPGEYGYWAMIIFSIVCLVARLVLLQKMVPLFSSLCYLTKILYPITLVIISTSAIIHIVHKPVQDITWTKFVYESAICIIVSLGCIAVLGLTKEERNRIYKLVQNRIHK